VIRLVTVGTGTVTPHATRASASHWVEIPSIVNRQSSIGIRLLMDCGAGTCHGLARHGLPWTTITHIAITHFHADHLGELPALIFAMKYGTMEHRSAPLRIVGPKGLRARLDGFATALGAWVTEPGFPLEITEITVPEGDSGMPAMELVTGVTLAACKTPHTPESVAYAIATGTERLVYTGDTGPSDAVGDWARGCDLLLAECSLPQAMAMDIHLTPETAGAMAARAQAKRLVLTHLYPPVEAVDIVGIVGKTWAGPTVVARDGDHFEIQTETD
jgi:ribonuclease BN (tRNA processing enzyme)